MLRMEFMVSKLFLPEASPPATADVRSRIPPWVITGAGRSEEDKVKATPAPQVGGYGLLAAWGENLRKFNAWQRRSV
jgi:hypothetical protein